MKEQEALFHLGLGRAGQVPGGGVLAAPEASCSVISVCMLGCGVCCDAAGLSAQGKWGAK